MIQSLYSLKSFRKKILGLRSVSDENSMLKAINELFSLYDSKKKKMGTLDPKKFISSVKQNNQEFNNEDHHDSHEFLTVHNLIKQAELQTEIKKLKKDITTKKVLEYLKKKHCHFFVPKLIN